MIKDLTGVVINGVRVLEQNGKSNANKQKWLCLCYCGNKFTCIGSQLIAGKTKSCGCLTKTHGDRKSALYSRWSGMKNRCSNPKDRQYRHYGGRGISVCERWLSYINFKEDMGASFKAHLSLDRINVNGNYSPDNCRWATITEQNRNKRNNTIIGTPKGEMTVIEAAEAFGIKETALHYRIKNQPKELWFLKKHQSYKQKRRLI